MKVFSPSRTMSKGWFHLSSPVTYMYVIAQQLKEPSLEE